MKKVFYGIVCAVLAATLSVGFIGCASDNEPTAPKEYTIQYTDESGAKQITVTQGQPYSLAVIPEKTGYIFLGLYDAEVGGTQYVTASGSSVSPYNEGRSIVLYPQYKAKEYTVILDYQGATVTGSRQLKVDYGTELPELPKNLSLEHKNFTGWYTQENGKGVQVADMYGTLPKVSVVNEINFTLASDGYIYLYAGFETEKFNVTCYFDEGMDEEIVKAEWNTPVSKIVTKTRKNGEAPLTWSKKSDKSELFNGNIEGDTVLYAVEYAPVIELDTDGGDEVNAVVARAGANISLPTPTKDGYKFVKWETLDGKTAEYSTMPTKSVSLKAVWQAKIVFDSNGGSEVNDISVAAGESIKLPTPEKEDFIFAGWYTEDKEQYTRTTMPATSTKLKAGWYKAMTVKKILITAEQQTYNSDSICAGQKKGPSADWRSKLDLSEYIPASGADIKLSFHAKMKWNVGAIGTGGFYFYDDVLVSDSNFLNKNTFTVAETTYKSYSFDIDLKLRTNTLYISYYASVSQDISGTMWKKLYFSDIWLDVHYPDTTNLYL